MISGPLAALLQVTLLGVLVTTSPACGDAPVGASPDAVTNDEVDEWGENEQPPTRDEILAAPSAFDADAVAEALVSVAEEQAATALPQVLALLADDREEIRWHAVQALKAIGGDQADAALVRLATEDPSELVREEATQR
jgi:HEAT repeat protein